VAKKPDLAEAGVTREPTTSASTPAAMQSTPTVNPAGLSILIPVGCDAFRGVIAMSGRVVPAWMKVDRSLLLFARLPT
jgi:hypothetical protein